MSLPLLKPKLKAYGTVPGGGEYKLNIPDKGFVASGYTFEALMRNIRTWRLANGFPNGLGLQEEVENEVCAKYPDECRESDVRVPDLNAKIGYRDVVNGASTLMRIKLAGTPMVSMEEATRRAGVCVKCPYNREHSLPCGGICCELKEVVEKTLGTEKTVHDPNLRACAICKCFNGIHVFFPVDIQTQGLSEEQRAQFALAKEMYGCWKG